MERHYVLEIKASGLKEKNKSPVANDSGGMDFSKGLLTKEQAKTYGKILGVYHGVKSFATQISNHETSMVSLRTGSNELQQRAQFINSTVQTGLGLIETITTGALVGGLPGALVGLAIGAAHTVIGYAQNQDKIDTEYALEKESIQRNSIRAGARGSRGVNE